MLVATAGHVDHGKTRLVKQFTDASGGMSVIEAKRVFGLGRNLTIEILEFFDQIGYTKSSGNLRLISGLNAAQLIQPK